MKTNELTGALLNYWVAKAEGIPEHGWQPPYSDDWAYGGPIIERKRISVENFDGSRKPGREWSAYITSPPLTSSEEICGPTPLIAAMRSYVASVYGADVSDGAAP